MPPPGDAPADAAPWPWVPRLCGIAGAEWRPLPRPRDARRFGFGALSRTFGAVVLAYAGPGVPRDADGRTAGGAGEAKMGPS